MRGLWRKPPTTTFELAVHELVRSVPPGRVVTYGDVAWAVGRPRAGRAVGNVMRMTPDSETTPCHRVVQSTGAVGSYGSEAGATARKIRRLRAEGIVVGATGRIKDFERVRWTPR